MTTPSAAEWVRRAIALTEQNSMKVSLTALKQKGIKNTSLLAAERDTFGWIYFKQGDLSNADRYVDAAWRLNQHSLVANHLGQIYEREGKQNQVVHMWRLAIAAQSDNEDAKQRLRNAGAPVAEPITRAESLKRQPAFAAEELGQLRTVKLSGLLKNTPTADYFVVVSRQGVQEVDIASENEAPKEVSEALLAANFDFIFPDEGSERIVRRGILSCSAYTDPECQFTMLPLVSTNIAGMRKSSDDTNVSGPVSTGDLAPPAAISKVEPEYPEAARKVGLEGTVLLKIVVDEAGLPQDVTVINSLGTGLDEAARACVLKSRFQPATKNSKPVKAAAQVEVNFKLLRPNQPDQ